MLLQLLDNISNEYTSSVEVTKGLSLEECVKLFSRVLKIPPNEIPKTEAEDIRRLCRGNPFIIACIANNLSAYERNETKRWQHWRDTLEKHE